MTKQAPTTFREWAEPEFVEGLDASTLAMYEDTWRAARERPLHVVEQSKKHLETCWAKIDRLEELNNSHLDTLQQMARRTPNATPEKATAHATKVENWNRTLELANKRLRADEHKAEVRAEKAEAHNGELLTRLDTAKAHIEKAETEVANLHVELDGTYDRIKQFQNEVERASP